MPHGSREGCIVKTILGPAIPVLLAAADRELYKAMCAAKLPGTGIKDRRVKKKNEKNHETLSF